MKKTGMPRRGELVICRITRINPNSAFATLTEYDKTGMIHVSEVAKRWVKNIREFIREDQYVVCKVIGIDERGISLSIKRVWREESRSKLNEFKKDRKAEKMLEMIGKAMGKPLDESWEQIGNKLEDEFGSLIKAFDIALKKPELFKAKGIKGPWAEKVIETIKKRRTEKVYELKAKMKLICYKPDGMEVIKKALSRAKDLEVRYISAPNYVLVGHGKDPKRLENLVKGTAEEIAKDIQKSQGEASFELVK